MKRRIGLAVLASVLVVSGCAADPVDSELDEISALVDGCAPGGAEVESIVVQGAFGAVPEVTFDAPLAVVQTQRAVIIEGSGEPVENGDEVIIDVSFLNGGSGAPIGDSGYDALSPVPFKLSYEDPLFSGISATLLCSDVGSRVIGLIPASALVGPSGNPEFGLGPGESLVAIFDLISIKPPIEDPLTRIEGAPRQPSEGFPGIEYEDSGRPSLTISEGDFLPEFAVDVLVEGNGQTVEPWSTIVLHYYAVNWTTGEFFDSSWDNAEPAIFPARMVIMGFRDGLIGQKVGSRVMIVIPPELGYGPSGGIPEKSLAPTDTLVFVVDILGVQ